jgi:hypothetical protein
VAQGDALAREFAYDITQKLYYYFTFPDSKQDFISNEIVDQFQYLEHLIYSVLVPHKRYDLVNELDQSLEIAELFFGMARNEEGQPEATLPPVNDRTRKEFLDSIDGYFVIAKNPAE